MKRILNNNDSPFFSFGTKNTCFGNGYYEYHFFGYRQHILSVTQLFFELPTKNRIWL